MFAQVVVSVLHLEHIYISECSLSVELIKSVQWMQQRKLAPLAVFTCVPNERLCFSAYVCMVMDMLNYCEKNDREFNQRLCVNE